MADAVIIFGPYRLAPAARLLLRGAEEILVGSRAMDVLIALVEAAGKVVGKRELIARAWPRIAVGDSSLRVTVAELRKTLGDGRNGIRYIANVTGRGYCFVAPIDQREELRGFGRRLCLPDPDPWPFAVGGAELLDEIATVIRRHVALSDHAAIAIALWVVHTHAFEASSIAPRLGITGPAKRCGRNILIV